MSSLLLYHSVSFSECLDLSEVNNCKSLFLLFSGVGIEAGPHAVLCR
jgi:hypothetical protein